MRCAKLANNQNHVVRANEPALQTPSLIGVSARAPFMHDGYALTLLDASPISLAVVANYTVTHQP